LYFIILHLTQVDGSNFDWFLYQRWSFVCKSTYYLAYVCTT